VKIASSNSRGKKEEEKVSPRLLHEFALNGPGSPTAGLAPWLCHSSSPSVVAPQKYSEPRPRMYYSISMAFHQQVRSINNRTKGPPGSQYSLSSSSGSAPSPCTEPSSAAPAASPTRPPRPSRASMPATNLSAIATSRISYVHPGVVSCPVSRRNLPLRTPSVENKLTCQQSHIRYLLSTGKTEWESMERYIKGM
jgi:hypothetical protein